MAAITRALASVPGAIASFDCIPADDAERKWTWLNGLLDARNPEYRAALPAVLKAVTEFIRRVLATHPLYARRRRVGEVGDGAAGLSTP